MIKHKIEIQIDKIVADERYYSFKWKATIDKKKCAGRYEGDYENHTPKEMIKILEKELALELVLNALGEK